MNSNNNNKKKTNKKMTQINNENSSWRFNSHNYKTKDQSPPCPLVICLFDFTITHQQI